MQQKRESGEEPGAQPNMRNDPEQNTEAYALRSRVDKWNLIKLQSFCKAKDTVKRTKWQPTIWEKNFTKPTPNRGLLSNI